jgi:hypothetical protein
MKSEPEPVGSQAELELAKIKYTAGDFDTARAGFDKVASNPASPFAADAKLFSLRCIRGAKKMDELESACKRILDDKRRAPRRSSRRPAPGRPTCSSRRARRTRRSGATS